MERFTAQLLTPVHEAPWQALWWRSERHLGLHWQWPALAAAGVGEPIRIGVFSKGEQLIAGLVFVQRSLRFRTEWHHPAPVPFAGLLSEPDSRGESFLRDALSAASQLIIQHVERAEIIFQPGLDDVRGLLWAGWSARPHYNYVSPVTERESLAGQSENAVRRQAAKAQALGLRDEWGAALLPEVFALWDQTRRRQHLPAYIHPDCHRNLLHFAASAPDPEIGAEVVGLRHPSTGALEAAMIIGRDPGRAYYLLGAADLEKDGAHGTGAPTLLHFAATARLFEQRGAYLYDWVGANTPSVSQFKKKFRPRLETYQRVSLRRGVLRFLP